MPLNLYLVGLNAQGGYSIAMSQHIMPAFHLLCTYKRAYNNIILYLGQVIQVCTHKGWPQKDPLSSTQAKNIIYIKKNKQTRYKLMFVSKVGRYQRNTNVFCRNFLISVCQSSLSIPACTLPLHTSYHFNSSPSRESKL